MHCNIPRLFLIVFFISPSSLLRICTYSSACATHRVSHLYTVSYYMLSCGTKNCSSVTKAMEHFQTLYPTAGAEGAAMSILRRVGDCVSGCAEAGEFEAEEPKSNPGGMPLASLSRRDAPGVLGTGGRPRGLRSEMSDV